MPINNLKEYSDNYSKASGSLWHYCKDVPAVNDNGDFVDLNEGNATDSFNFKGKVENCWKSRCLNNGSIKILK